MSGCKHQGIEQTSQGLFPKSQKVRICPNFQLSWFSPGRNPFISLGVTQREAWRQSRAKIVKRSSLKRVAKIARRGFHAMAKEDAEIVESIDG